MDTNLQNELKSYSNKNSKKKYFFIIIIVLLLITGVYYFFFANQSKKEEVNLYNTKKVTRGDLSVIVSATGTLNPTNSVEIGVEVSGTIKEIYVDFNDEVEVGQLLAILDTRKLQSEVDGQTASLGISKANLKESEVNLRNKKTVYDRTLKMYNSSGGKYPSINELDDAKFAYESSVSSFEAAKAKVEQSSFSLNTAKQNLDKAYVKSSIKGIVLNRAVEVGQNLGCFYECAKTVYFSKRFNSNGFNSKY